MFDRDAIVRVRVGMASARLRACAKRHLRGITHPEPSDLERSTVLVGATTMKGMLCLAASTAALYVPTYQQVWAGWCDLQIDVSTLLAVSPFLAMRSAPTTATKVGVIYASLLVR